MANAPNRPGRLPTAQPLRMRAMAFARCSSLDARMVREGCQWVRYRSFFRSANCADSRRMLTNEGNLLKPTSGTNGDVKPLLAW